MENLDIIVGIVVYFILDPFLDLSSINSFSNDYWNKSNSWTYKWKRVDKVLQLNSKKLWYYLYLYKPRFREAFPYSSTILVSLTDGWHLIKTIKLVILSLVIMQFISITNYYLVDILLFHFVRFLIFEIIYNKMIKR